MGSPNASNVNTLLAANVSAPVRQRNPPPENVVVATLVASVAMQSELPLIVEYTVVRELSQLVETEVLAYPYWLVMVFAPNSLPITGAAVDGRVMEFACTEYSAHAATLSATIESLQYDSDGVVCSHASDPPRRGVGPHVQDMARGTGHGGEPSVVKVPVAFVPVVVAGAPAENVMTVALPLVRYPLLVRQSAATLCTSSTASRAASKVERIAESLNE